MVDVDKLQEEITKLDSDLRQQKEMLAEICQKVNFSV